ncbi:unnamed protein product [Choristocarpus tenellus]
MLLFEMCHVPFATRMERILVLTKARKLNFPPEEQWGPPRGQEAARTLCTCMLQSSPGDRPSAADVVHQVEMMQGKHMLLQLDDKQQQRAGGFNKDGHRRELAVVLRVETVEKEGLLHKLVDRIKAHCGGQKDGINSDPQGGEIGNGSGDGGAVGEGKPASTSESRSSGARLEQYGLRGYTGMAVMEFLIGGAKLDEREAIIADLESLPDVKSVHEIPAEG